MGSIIHKGTRVLKRQENTSLIFDVREMILSCQKAFGLLGLLTDQDFFFWSSILDVGTKMF